MKKVILSSFHSCSLHALECEGVEPDRILSFDSHIDTNLLGVLEEVLSMIDDNRSLRYAFTDGGTHALMTKAFPHTDIDIVTPKVWHSCKTGFQKYSTSQQTFLQSTIWKVYLTTKDTTLT